MSTSHPTGSESRVATAFRPLVGQLCWGVALSIDHVLMVEFGDPHLQVHEPRETDSESEQVRRRCARRSVAPVGEWHLHSHVCYWELRRPGQPTVSLDHAAADLREPLRDLDGQRLERVEYDRGAARMVWHFDLGAVVVFRPHRDTKPDDELWALFEPDGMVFALRADGAVYHMTGATPQCAEVWEPDSESSG